MMSAPPVSIIIPAFNSANYIVETINSVLQQSMQDFEIIVVDDGSTDQLKEVLAPFIVKKQIKYIAQANLGVSAARNHGFKKSRGQYIAFLDADDVWLNDNLEARLNKFKSGDFGLVHADAFVIDEKSNKLPQILSGKEGNILNDILAWNGTQVPGPSSILVKREVVDTVGLFDEQLSTSADQDFFIRVAAQYKIGRVDKVTWMYRIHTNNMHKNIARMEHDVLRVFEKAREANLFESAAFRRKCFSRMYLILAASWAGDGQNIKRGFYFFIKAIAKRPSIIGTVTERITKKWFR
ncbi:glycosyltransferase family 2 protein [Ohtaekwangia kribbensis]|jgi:glycosyltransferase involved in cell wall biosynthesis|uniref:Glycosyltransferase family 2 protein n=1 Tax=Ohtaekwangia kribbensis TaxID=688913 RepID=A0ABW3K4F0_9BACT